MPYLSSVARKIAEQTSIKEFNIGALFPDTRPSGTPKTSNSGPMFNLEVSHPVKENIKRNPRELVTNNDIRVSLVQCHLRSKSINC